MMKISNLIFLSISFILVMFSITTYVNYRQSEEVRENAAFHANSSTVVRLSNQFQRNVLYIERALRGYLLTNEEYLLPTYDSAFAENKNLLAELDLMLEDTSQQQQKLTDMQLLYQDWVSNVAQPLLQAKQSGEVSAANSALIQEKLNLESIFNLRIQQRFKELLNAEYENREMRRKKLEDSETETKQISILFTSLSIIVGFIIALILARHITNRISKMVRMANSIASGNYNVQVKDRNSDELSQLTSSLNHMAQMLEENFVQLKRKNEELDQFAHVASHDLKAPLRGIDNVVKWIEEDHADELSPKVHEYLELIKKRIERSQNLVQGILTYARIGKEETRQEAINTKELLTEIVEGLPQRHGITIDVQSNMPVVFTDRIPLSQVFTNLLSNAVKYHNRVAGSIKVYYKDEGLRNRFYVEDDGPGIAAAYHDKIFVIFQTLQERDTFESTGVGLSIIKKILDDRKETIELVSEEGKGAIFSFTWKK